MPVLSFLDLIPLDAFLLVALLGLVVAIEGGFQLGLWRRTQRPLEKAAPVGAVVAATLGLVGFILGMTFSFAVSRFEARQEAYLAEINAIGTTYLRADFLPEPQREHTKQTLLDYVEVRASIVDYQSITEVLALSEEAHSKLWSTLTSIAPSHLNSMSVALYTQSLNELIDLHEQRLMAGVRLRIPQVLWVVLLLISLLGMGEIGYQTALAGSSRTPVTLGLVIAFALLLYLIADLDRPLEGSLRVNQAAMRELGNKLRKP
jgi:hypothetical protein